MDGDRAVTNAEKAGDHVRHEVGRQPDQRHQAWERSGAGVHHKTETRRDPENRTPLESVHSPGHGRVEIACASLPQV